MVSNGFATSVDHPGGNATGIDELPPGVTAKRLSLLNSLRKKCRIRRSAIAS
jgi:putative tryptophan/tyrosine transport system substrate-binding protein